MTKKMTPEEKLAGREKTRRLHAAIDHCPGSPDGHEAGPVGIRWLAGGEGPGDKPIVVRVLCRHCGRPGEGSLDESVAWQPPEEDQ